MLDEDEFLILAHPEDNGIAWNGKTFSSIIDEWEKYRDVQQYGDRMEELRIRGIVFRTIKMRSEAQELTEGENKGKWVVAYHCTEVQLHKN